MVISSDLRGIKTGVRDEDMTGEWDWVHGAVKSAGKTEKVLGFLLDGVAW